MKMKKKTIESGTQYADTYLHGNENDLDEAVTAHLRGRLKKKPRFLIRNLRITDEQSTPKVITINNDYCRIDTKTLKRRPFHRAGFYFYKQSAFRSTKQNHKQVTLDQYNRFSTFHNDWLAKNQSETESINNLWLKTHRSNTNNDKQPFTIEPNQTNNENDLNQPPYHHHQRYQLIETDKSN